MSQANSATEICVLCHKDTGIPCNCHVDDRLRKGHYVQGSGQLCKSCFNAVYYSSTDTREVISCS